METIPASSLTGTTGRFAYIVDTEGKLAVGNRRYGHIDLSGGADVQATGEIKIVNGEVVSINNASGHYKPFGATAKEAAERAFKSFGLPVSDSAYREIGR